MPSEQGHRLYHKPSAVESAHIPDMNIKNIKIHVGTSEIRAKRWNATRTDRGRHVSYQRSKRTVNPNTSLIKIDGVESTEAANFYLGKKVAFVYRAKREVRGSNIRVIWGKVTRPHGNSGVVRAQFRHNLPPKTFGATVRVMLYPSNI
ncbi:60S ribosomal protein L33B [Aspergillus niger]|nr:60S ribosomal protein L33B [Aspergillus niger]GKZ84519.1 60S ribosomal protein L33B [Aspergillus niger]GLA09338.1 60S ribosomal protein L33B [Aspergillus niger]GLA33215.1 60S ribosomal protein L33B [Aspergillus niger]